jgi:hypothetical protein
MHRVTAGRIAISRAISRRLYGMDIMFCAIADYRRWWIRHPLNWVFWWDRDHCADAHDWEAMQGREPGLLDEWRREGWL